jgi:ubiquinone biosynthesis protein Coq4
LLEKKLQIKKIEPKNFDERHYALYLNVLRRSKYPLETLGIDFFKNFDAEIYEFYLNDNNPIAFVQIKQIEDILYFVFGGMDYSSRDELDLYYNMLLYILQIGLERGVRLIDFGQTAESAKMRLGCKLSKKFMYARSSNGILNFGLKVFAGMLVYNDKFEYFNVFGDN